MPKEALIEIIFVLDGEENRSREYSVEDVRRRVKHQSGEYAWEFLFLGANQDAWLEAGKMGMERAIGFVADAKGVKEAYVKVEEAVREVRGRGKRD